MVRERQSIAGVGGCGRDFTQPRGKRWNGLPSASVICLHSGCVLIHGAAGGSSSCVLASASVMVSMQRPREGECMQMKLAIQQDFVVQ